MRRVIVEDGIVVTGDGRVIDGGTVVVEGAEVQAVLEAGADLEPHPGDWRIPADGRLVTAGLVDGFTALPAPAERAASRLVEAVAAGVTTAFATAAPGDCPRLADFALRLGVRLCLAPWSASAPPAVAAVREVAERAARGRGRLHPAVVVPDGATAGPDVLDAARSLARELGAPLLLPVARDDEALSRSFARFDARPVERLDALGLLEARTVLVHGNVLDAGELDAVASAGSVLCAVPREAPAGVPTALCARASARGVALALGTGATGGSPLAEVAVGAVRGDDPVALADALAGGARLLTAILGSAAGRLVPGEQADVVVHGWRPDRALDPVAWTAAIPWGTRAAWSIIGGEVVLREGRLLGVDARAVADAARRVPGQPPLPE